MCLCVVDRSLDLLSPIPPLPFCESSRCLLSGNEMTFTHLPSLTANSSQYSARNNVNPESLCQCTSSRWQHTTQRGRATLARWSSSSRTQTGPAVPAGLSSKEEFYPTASRWPGVSITYHLPLILNQTLQC